MTDDEKLAEARRLCPEGYVVVPRDASGIMAMRGAQTKVGWSQPYEDCAAEYFRFDEPETKLEQALAPQNRYDDDDREYWLVAAIWRGCISGMEEWQSRREKEGATDFVVGWEKPFLPHRKDWLKKKGIDPEKYEPLADGQQLRNDTP